MGLQSSLRMMGLSMRLGFGFGAVWVLAGVCAWGQVAPGQAGSRNTGTTLVEPPAPLLLLNDVMRDGDGPADEAEAKAVLKEDGLKRRESRVGTAAGTWVTAYEFGDATGAVAAYTYFRAGGKATGGKRVNATEAVAPGGETTFLSGTTVVRAKGFAEEALRRIETGLPKVGGRRGLTPLLPRMLPPEGLDMGSMRYALGPAGYQAMGGVLPAEMLGWDKSLETATAAYSGRGGKGTLTLLLYPTPQIAGDRGRAIEKAVNDAGGSAKFGMVKMRRVGPLVGMTSGALPAAKAQGLMDALHLQEEVTFDKPMPLEFHTEVKKTASLLQNIAVLSGVLILAAVLLGVFLGGARAGIRVLQGKPAASEPEFLTISLRDKPKALFTAKDSGEDARP